MPDAVVRKDKRGRRINDQQGRNRHPTTVREAVEQGLVQRREGICERCGRQHWLCSGHHRVYDKTAKPWRLIELTPCEKWTMHGQAICFTHGGAGRNRKVAERQWRKEQAEGRAMAKLEKTVRTLGLAIKTNPQDALLEELYRTAGAVAWLEAQVGELSAEELAWGRISEEKRTGIGEMETNIDLTTTVMGAKTNILMELYHKERAHLVHVAKVAIQCGIAERQVKLAEEQGAMIAQALRAVGEDPALGLSSVQVEVFRVTVARVLRTLSTQQHSAGNGQFMPKLLPPEE